MRSRPAQVLFLLLLGLLAACKEPLYSDLSENDANNMIAVLSAAQIEASRTKEKDGRYSVNVAEMDVGAAVTILKSHGLPREKFSSLGEVFDASGLVGTPFEERARYMFALSQELSHTIAEIKGIESARVHIVLPQEDRFAKSPAQSSASIAIYTDKQFDLAAHATTIKQLVAFGVPNLPYDKVALAKFASSSISVTRVPAGSDYGSAEAAEAVPAGQQMLAGVPTSIPFSRQRPAHIAIFGLIGIFAFVVCMFVVRQSLIAFRRNDVDGSE